MLIQLCANTAARLCLQYVHHLEQGFPTWGACTPRGTFAYLKGYI